MKSDEPVEVHEISRNPAKPRVRIHEIAKLVRENGHEKMSVAEMMEKYGISEGSTTKVRQILKAQVEQHQNGHSK